MIRADMISTVGRKYLTSNIENDEYSYPKAFSAASLPFVPVRNNNGRAFEKLDIRFVKDNVTVLIETKRNFTKADEAQLSAYVEYEKRLTGNKTVAVLANTTNEDVRVWRGVVSDSDYMPKETTLRTMDEYVDFYISKVNDKEKVMQNTYKLNEKLHRHSIEEGNAIAIGDTTATCSYQAEKFVCGDHIVICRAKWMNLYTALFLLTLLKQEKYKYSYGRAFKMQLIAETRIKLPAQKDGAPDWNYMEKYIKSLNYKPLTTSNRGG